MSAWKGGWGFDEEVEKCVADAIPPFLIGVEQSTVLPFSAETGQTFGFEVERMQHEMDTAMTRMSIAPQAEPSLLACGGLGKPDSWSGMLAWYLEQWVNQIRSEGITQITDDMIKHRARVVLYGSPDQWDRTRAEHPEWLELFKRKVGLSNGTLPSKEAAAGFALPPAGHGQAATASMPSEQAQGLPQPDAKMQERAWMVWVGTMSSALEQWVHSQQAAGATPTADQLRNQARLIVYGSSNPSNPTMADDHDWLLAFQQRMGLLEPSVQPRTALLNNICSPQLRGHRSSNLASVLSDERGQSKLTEK